jgi:hypothetical protein
VGTRATLADALHQAAQRAAALACLSEADAIQTKIHPAFPSLYSNQGFRYCDLLLAEPERS